MTVVTCILRQKWRKRDDSGTDENSPGPNCCWDSSVLQRCKYDKNTRGNGTQHDCLPCNQQQADKDAGRRTCTPKASTSADMSLLLVAASRPEQSSSGTPACSTKSTTSKRICKQMEHAAVQRRGHNENTLACDVCQCGERAQAECARARPESSQTTSHPCPPNAFHCYHPQPVLQSTDSTTVQYYCQTNKA